MRKITTAEALAAQIQDGATIAISGNGGGMVEADHILAAIEARFLQTGHPRDLTLIHSLGIGDRDCTVLRTQRCSNALLPGTLPGRPKCRRW
ncbi:CoA-transferase [Shigella sonnei]|nr:hypothetical protein AW008_07590 [Shigella sonnei]CSN65406.1 CoA-transferase [Shigella sonnei]CSQ10030.1 CoA-transferase [Shigella sonnei]CSQ15572.1 CoA-transferase [Shigella sonnei]CSQ36653.1 CoA-transferase [Shigella sonnei]